MAIYRSMIILGSLSYLLLCFSSAPASAQVVGLSGSRFAWFTQSISNSVPLAYQFEASATGSGLVAAQVVSPAGAAQGLAGNSFLMFFSTNFAAASLAGTNVISGSNQLNAAFPVGNYQFTTRIATTNPITKQVTYSTNNSSLRLTNDFPVVTPRITNILPFASVAATQTFQWPRFSSTTNNASISFYVLEGLFDTNTLTLVATNGWSTLTNFSLVANESRLAATTAAYTVANLDPALDHIAVLEFHASSPQSPSFPVLQGESVSGNVVLYLAPRTNTVAIEIQATNQAVQVSWPAAAGTNWQLSVTMDLAAEGLGAGNEGDNQFVSRRLVWSRVTNRVELTAQGRYQVTVPTLRQRGFFRLESGQ